MQGFCRNVLDENDNGKCGKMISYMSDLMEDSTDFFWQGAKVVHTVLCCELELGTVLWDDTDHIDCIRWAHAQKHTRSSTKPWPISDNSKKQGFCKYYQNRTCQYAKDHDVNGKMHRHLLILLAARPRCESS